MKFAARCKARACRAASTCAVRAAKLRRRSSSLFTRFSAAAKTCLRREGRSAVPGKLAPRPPLLPRASRRFCRLSVCSLSRILRKRDRMASSSVGSTSYIVGWCVRRIVSYSSWLRMLRSNLHGTDIPFLHSVLGAHVKKEEFGAHSADLRASGVAFDWSDFWTHCLNFDG